MTEPHVRSVAIDEVLPLRRAILRAGTSIGDGDPHATHVVASFDGHTVGVGSIHPEPMPGGPGDAWRLTGVAVDHGHRGRGAGALIVERLLDRIADGPGRVVWARIPAGTVGFFERYGFERSGQPSTGPIGPEYLVHVTIGPIKRSWALAGAARI